MSQPKTARKARSHQGQLYQPGRAGNPTAKVQPTKAERDAQFDELLGKCKEATATLAGFFGLETASNCREIGKLFLDLSFVRERRDGSEVYDVKVYLIGQNYEALYIFGDKPISMYDYLRLPRVWLDMFHAINAPSGGIGKRGALKLTPDGWNVRLDQP